MLLPFYYAAGVVSIHLMLLFISIPTGSSFPVPCFNTSHVVIYPIEFGLNMLDYSRFNTSHVVIYPNPDGLQVATNKCFNTSHVVIYQTFAFPP